MVLQYSLVFLALLMLPNTKSTADVVLVDQTVLYTRESVCMLSRAAPFQREPLWEMSSCVSVSWFYVFLSISRPDQWYSQVLTASIHRALITPSLLSSVRWCPSSLYHWVWIRDMGIWSPSCGELMSGLVPGNGRRAVVSIILECLLFFWEVKNVSSRLIPDQSHWRTVLLLKNTCRLTRGRTL